MVSENDQGRHLREFHKKLSEFKAERDRNKLDDYIPYLKQKEFHELGATKTERLLSAGNQLGKTIAGAHEAAYHATGKYPKWWKGRKWDRPTRGWIGGESSTVVRDTSQKLLLGDLTESLDRLGTGIIPADDIVDYSLARGVAMGIDTLTVRHKSGKGNSVLKFKSYEMQRQKWQGDTIDWVWYDEEPPPDIYTEGLARFTATDGMAWMTFTPLKGMSTIVKRFKLEHDDTRAEVNMTAYDAKHITKDLLRKMLAKYPLYEHECRINGVPMRGEGRIFNLAESTFSVTPFEIPDWWNHIIGLDLGHGDHPTAGVWLGYDRDTDTVYIYRTYRVKGANIPTHASALRAAGRIPVAWPHDANAPDKFSGTAVKNHYQNENVLMLPEHAQFPDGGNTVWQGIVEMQTRMEQGRLKVFSNCHEWFEEFRNYHFENGKIAKVDDDLLDATRYGIMMLRRAKTIDRNWYPGRKRPVGGNTAPMDFDVLR